MGVLFVVCLPLLCMPDVYTYEVFFPAGINLDHKVLVSRLFQRVEETLNVLLKMLSLSTSPGFSINLQFHGPGSYQSPSGADRAPASDFYPRELRKTLTHPKKNPNTRINLELGVHILLAGPHI